MNSFPLLRLASLKAEAWGERRTNHYSPQKGTEPTNAPSNRNKLFPLNISCPKLENGTYLPSPSKQSTTTCISFASFHLSFIRNLSGSMMIWDSPVEVGVERLESFLRSVSREGTIFEGGPEPNIYIYKYI